MAKFGKKYVEAAKKVDRTKTYSVAEAVKLAKETNIAKFDASVEVSFKLNVDPRHADQQIRGAMYFHTVLVKHRRSVLLHRGRKSRKRKMPVQISLVEKNCWKTSRRDGSTSMSSLRLRT